MNTTQHNSTSLNIQAFRGKEHRGLNSTQRGSVSSCEATVQWLCSQIYLSLHPAIPHCFSTSLLCWISTALFLQSRWHFPSNKRMLVHTSIIFLSHSPAHGERQQQKLSHLWIFTDLLFLEGLSDECFLANALQSGKSGGFGIASTESPQNI